MTSPGSALPRRMLGRQLHALRTRSGVSAQYAREAIGVGKQTLWRMETGQPMRLNPLYVEKLCQVYGASEQVTRMLLGLTEETRKTGWWHAYGETVPNHVDLFVGLEQTATRFTAFQTTLLPGLLQTTEYRRALTWAMFPSAPTAEVERRIELFDRRRSRLTAKNPPAFHAIVDEAALRRAVGGPAVMADQLTHLAKMTDLRNISLRVIPFDAEGYAGQAIGSFVILEFPAHPTTHLTDPPIVYIQGHTGALYLEKSDEVHQYEAACTELRRSALDELRSADLIHTIATEYSP